MTMKKNSHRRALGDIGNLIGTFSTKCVISNRAAGAENHVVGGKKSITVTNRPVTRQSTATLAKNQHLPQVVPVGEEHVQCGAKKLNTMGFNREKPNIKPDVQKSMEDCRVLDSVSSQHYQDCRVPDSVSSQYYQDCRVPDSVSSPPRIITRSGAALLKTDENDPMLVDSIVENKEDIEESSEMEIDEAEDPVPNIDESDEGNPLAVSRYIQDMSRFYREKEGLSCVPPDYMSHQTEINHNMRAVVVNWIIEVHLKLSLVPATLFLAVNLMDRYLSSQRDLTRIELPVVGITAMLVASKYEETNGPCVKDFMNFSNSICKENDVLQMESSMLKVLQFNIFVPTPYVFLNRFLKAAQADEHLEMVSSFLVELCLVEYVMLRYPLSVLAAAAVYTGQSTLRRFPLWKRTMEHYTAYTEDQLQECAKLMVGFHQNSRNDNLIAVHNKYSMDKFNIVAQLAPVLFTGQRGL